MAPVSLKKPCADENNGAIDIRRSGMRRALGVQYVRPTLKQPLAE
jgi:hypothetical protein